MNELLRDQPLELTLPILASLAVLWFGAFLFMRSRTSVFLKMTGMALMSIWFYVSGAIMLDHAQSFEASIFWWHWGWTTPVSVVLWFHAIVHLSGLRNRSPKLVLTLLALGYVSASALIVLGYYSDLVVIHAYTFELSGWNNSNFLDAPGPLYPVFMVHLLVYLGGATTVLISRLSSDQLRSTLRYRQDSMLAAGSFLSLIGAFLIGILVFYEIIDLNESSLQPLLLLGLLLICVASISYEGLMETRLLRRHFAYSSAGASIIAVALIFVLIMTDAHVVESLIVIAAFLIAYAYHDAAVNSSEKLISSGLTRLSGMLGLEDPDTSGNQTTRVSLIANIDREEVCNQVELAVKHFLDNELLALSPLTQFEIVASGESSRSAYGQIFTFQGTPELSPDAELRVRNLRDLIRAATEALRPMIDDPGTEVFDDVWGPYAACLYYLEGGRSAESIWRRKWRLLDREAGVVVAKPLELRLLSWRKSESQSLHRKWRNRYLVDGISGIANFLLEKESRG